MAGTAEPKTARHCKACGKKVAPGNVWFCQRRCKQRWNALKRHYEEGTPEFAEALARRRAAWLEQDDGWVAPPPGTTMWGGNGGRKTNQVPRVPDTLEWDEFCRDWAEKLASNEIKPKVVHEATGWHYTKISRLYERWCTEVDRARAAEDGQLGRRAIKALGDFGFFRETYFTDFRGNRYTHGPHHRRWTGAALSTLDEGGRCMVLAPPRHGKTELLIHLCIWLIIRNPNIRILWIGGNLEIARQSVNAVMDELEHNELLRADFLLEGQEWRPAKGSGKEWSRDRFKVATRTVTGTADKSPTMAAVGRGGKLLSRDADIIVGDDIVDHDSTNTPSAREDTLRWISTQLISRKEAHTAMFLIGSRQHHEDLYGSLLQNPMWQCIVDSAHSQDCELPDHEWMGADHIPANCPQCKDHKDCTLWPKVRPFTFLQEQRISYDNDELYEMVYNNVTRPSGALYVTWEDINRSWDDRRIGELPKHRDELLLIAGLDPSAANQQAAFLWAYDTHTRQRWAIDLDEQKGGGLPGAREIIKRWWRDYQVGWWVIEKNNYQEAVIHDIEIRDFCARHGIKLTPTFTTAKNKHDPAMGVTAMMSLFKRDEPQMVFLPGGDEGARAKFKRYGKQLVNFDGILNGSRKARPGSDDLVMASWFPELKFRPLSMEDRSAAVIQMPNRMSYGPTRMGDSYKRMEVG